MKKSLAALFILAPLFFVSGCAHLHKAIPREQITLPDAEKIVSRIEEQGDNIRSFYSLGVVSINGWILAPDADILVAGIRDPFTLKIEITHSWGRPIIHILIRGDALNVVSFQEKLIYSGTFTPEALSKFIPGFSLDQKMIWSILSGRPPVISHETVSVSGPDMITLANSDGLELETIHLQIEGSFPKKVDFPQQSLAIFFSDLQEAGEIPYAGEIKLSGEKIEKEMILKTKKLALNVSVPDQIFSLEIPSSYGTVNLDDIPETEER